MHSNLLSKSPEVFVGELLRTVTVAGVEAHYREHLGTAHPTVPAISCDLEKLAALMPCFDLLAIFSPRAHAMIWLTRIDDDHFAIVTALHASVIFMLRMVAGMGEEAACVRSFRDEFRHFAHRLDGLLSQVEAIEV